MFAKYRWLLLFFVALFVATLGLWLGRTKEKDYLGAMYARKNFTLMDDQGELFELRAFPANQLLLVVFTPDGISPAWVRPFSVFSRRVKELEALDVRTLLITRTNREIARNFKEAAGFSGRLLLDPSGTVGRIVDVWPSPAPVGYWGYALMDRELNLYWVAKEAAPMEYDRLLAELKKISASKTTSSE